MAEKESAIRGYFMQKLKNLRKVYAGSKRKEREKYAMLYV